MTFYFQHARRLTSAVWANIVYSEFLPALLGNEAYKFYGLSPDVVEYNPTLNPDLTTEFTSAAYRLGHTMAPDDAPFTTTDFEDFKKVPIREVYPP